MAASYPSAAKAFTPIVDGVDYPQAAQVNAIYDEVTALEAALLTGGLAHNLFPDATTRTLGSAAKPWGDTYIATGKKLYLDSGGDSYIYEATANEYAVVIGGAEILRFTATGLKFPATQIPSSDANTLDDYEEGDWTPTDASGAALVFTGVEGKYWKCGQMVIAACRLTFPATADGNNSAIGGLPFTALASSNSIFSSTITGLTSEATVARVSVVTGDVKALPYTTGAARVTNATLTTDVLSFVAIYRAAA